MTETVYKIIELVGTSEESWEQAAANAIKRAADSLEDLRIAEVVKLDMHLDDGEIVLYRTRISVSFKYHEDE